jgi:hypothetical protein
VLLKKTKITQFKELFWKIKILLRKEMLSMHTKKPRVKKSAHLLPILPLIPQKTTKMDEDKGKFIAFDLKTRVGPPPDATKYKKYQDITRGSDKSNQFRTCQPILECSHRNSFSALSIGNSATLDEQEYV